MFAEFLGPLQQTSFTDTQLGLGLGLTSVILASLIWKRSRRGDVGLVPGPVSLPFT